MIIKDINGKERTIIDKSMKIVYHKHLAKGPHAKKGQMITKKFIEVLIKPQNPERTPWKEWYPFSKFKEYNPNVDYKLLDTIKTRE